MIPPLKQCNGYVADYIKEFKLRVTPAAFFPKMASHTVELATITQDFRKNKKILCVRNREKLLGAVIV